MKDNDGAAPLSAAGSDPFVDAGVQHARAIALGAASMRVGIVVVELAASGPRVLWVNSAVTEILGASIEEVAHDPISFIAPEDRARILERLGARRRGEPVSPSVELAVQRRDGTRVAIEVTVSDVPSTLEGRTIIVAFVHDITSRKAVEAALRTSEARFRIVIESAPDAIVISRNGVILYGNPAAARLLGYDDMRALPGLDLKNIIPADDAQVMMQRIRGMLERGERFPPREYRAIRRDGSMVMVEIVSHPIDYDGAPAILGFGRDVTERSRMHEQLARADRLAGLGTLAAGVAHEINNPLTFVSLGIEALEGHLKRGITDPSARAAALAMLDPIRTGAHRMAEIVRDLRTFSRPEPEQPSLVDLTEVVRTAERISAHEIKHRARLEVSVSGAPWVVGHTGRLEQVMVNLLVNAAQAFEKPRPDATITVSLRELDGVAEVAVRDNGAGIPAEILPRIFDPFFTTKPAGIGTGLGLSICHGIVTRMRGEITVESMIGEGTTVRVRLPLATIQRPRAPMADESVQTAGDSLRVLVVDNEPALCRTVKAVLEPPHDVTIAHGGDPALELLRDEKPFDVILCDVMMPNMTGPELFDRAVAEHPELGPRFVFMTGGAVTQATEAFLSKSPNTLLQKPFTPAQLRDLLRKLVRA